MSRRRGEFEHRTSIFEGAFRAWSHLGGLDPEDLESKPASELDPLNNPIENDPRWASQKMKDKDMKDPILNPDGTKRREYPYEPLPRSGLAHPYVQAILSPWLGPDADNDAIQLGLTTLRTWWQHRRKGESGSAVAALGTEKMKGVVEGYTRHFFTLAHCLIMNDKEQPPRSLHAKMKELEKTRNKKGKKRAQNDDVSPKEIMSQALNPVAESIASDPNTANMTPLERLHAAQRRQLAESGGVQTALGKSIIPDISTPLIDIKAKCVPGKVDLPAVVEQVNHHATQLAHRGLSGAMPNDVTSSDAFGDSESVPVVYVSQNGDIVLAMIIEGITCAHCVKIVETVLKGCNGSKSPIDGLVDAAADRILCCVLIKIDRVSNARRIAFEASRNLAMVGYTAKATDMPSTMDVNGSTSKVDKETFDRAFDVAGRNDPRVVFQWQLPCSCPDNGIMREDCQRHSQMSPTIFDEFENRKRTVQQYISTGNLESVAVSGANLIPSNSDEIGPAVQSGTHHHHSNDDFQPAGMGGDVMVPMNSSNINPGSGMDMYGNTQHSGGMQVQPGRDDMGMSNQMPGRHSMAQRNSVISFGGRNMSFVSEAASFGRAMSGLSALSIDWENMDDFDINVDHSAHINNAGGVGASMMEPPSSIGMGGSGGRRSSLRRSFAVNDQDAHVSFKL